MEGSDVFTHTKTIPCWIDPNLCVMNTKWRFYKLTNLTIFAALLKEVPLGCKNAVLPEPLLKTHTINCLTFDENTRQPYNDNLCLFRALALHMYRNQRLEEETSKLFNLFINEMDGLSPNQFQGVHMNDVPTVEDLLTLNILLYDIDIVDGTLLENLQDEVCRNTKILCGCEDTTTTYATWTTLMKSSNLFAALIVTLFSTKHSIWSDI